MKYLKTILPVAIVMLAMALPSIASAQYHEERLDKFLSGNPALKRQLERNPDLIYDRKFRHEHPALQEFMQNHPNVWGKLRNSNRWGAYGPNNEWHEADWWHQNNPGWMYKNHPEWAENRPEWRDEGDFDERREWHDRDWWNNNHPDWVQRHHPNWYKHQEHQAAKEQKWENKHDHDNDAGNTNEYKHGHHRDQGDHGHN